MKIVKLKTSKRGKMREMRDIDEDMTLKTSRRGERGER